MLWLRSGREHWAWMVVSWLRSGEGEGGEGGGEGEGGGDGADIKSNNPHLTGGELQKATSGGTQRAALCTAPRPDTRVLEMGERQAKRRREKA